MREMETKKDTSEVKKSTSKSPSPKDDNTSQEGKDSTPTPRSGTPFIGCAPPMSRAGTDDSVEIILG